MTDRDLWAPMPLTNLPSGTQDRQACIRYLLAIRPESRLRMQRDSPQCASMGWMDERREKKQIEHYEERWIRNSIMERSRLL